MQTVSGKGPRPACPRVRHFDLVTESEPCHVGRPTHVTHGQTQNGSESSLDHASHDEDLGTRSRGRRRQRGPLQAHACDEVVAPTSDQQHLGGAEQGAPVRRGSRGHRRRAPRATVSRRENPRSRRGASRSTAAFSALRGRMSPPGTWPCSSRAMPAFASARFARSSGTEMWISSDGPSRSMCRCGKARRGHRRDARAARCR